MTGDFMFAVRIVVVAVGAIAMLLSVLAMGILIFAWMVDLVLMAPRRVAADCERDQAVPVRVAGDWYCIVPLRKVGLPE